MSSLLQFVWYKDLVNWSVKSYLNSNLLHSQFELVLLGKLITPRQEKVKKEDYRNDIELVKKISFKDGIIHLRDEKQTKTDLYKIYPNDFLISKLNFHQKALALNNYEQLLLSTTDYQPYTINNSILDSKYLVLVLRGHYFQENLRNINSEGVKPRAKPEFIKTLKIPLPPLEIQQQLVKNYQDKINLAKGQEAKAEQLEADIETYLYQELGIKKQQEKKNTDLLQFAQFKDLDRWDILYLLNENSIASNYNTVSIGYILDTFLRDKNNNSLRFNSQQKPKEDFKYIGMENIKKETGTLLEYQKVKGANIKSQTVRLPDGFFLYGKLRPYLNKYFYNNSDHDNIIVSSEFFVFSVKNVNHLYFKFCLSSNFIQHQVTNHMKGARMPRISEEVFKNLKIPLPPLEIQNKIANYIQGLKDGIKTLKQQAKQNRELALAEFEAEIFDVSP